MSNADVGGARDERGAQHYPPSIVRRERPLSLRGARAGLRAGIRRGELSPILATLLGIYLFIYIWSVPMLMLDLVPVWGRGMGGFLLMLQGTIIGLWLARAGGLGGLVAAGAILLLSYLVEFVGVSYGVPFGRYAYTDVLGLQLGGAVPLAIPFAWLVVVPGAVMLAARAPRAWQAAPLATLLAILLDLLIEPVAAHVTGYWRWLEPGPYYGVPTVNFVAWGATALALVLVLRILAPNLRQAPRSAWLPRLLFVLNAIQFTLVNAAYGFWWAVAAGIGLLGCIYAIGDRGREQEIRVGDKG
jgi:putative membrane protein